MNETSIIIPTPTITTLVEALWILGDTVGDWDQTVTVSIIDGSESLILTAGIVAKPRPAHAGKKQRCATKDAAGRRCVRGPRHPEQHRYENGE